jgi:hypothetical protein
MFYFVYFQYILHIWLTLADFIMLTQNLNVKILLQTNSQNTEKVSIFKLYHYMTSLISFQNFQKAIEVAEKELPKQLKKFQFISKVKVLLCFNFL